MTNSNIIPAHNGESFDPLAHTAIEAVTDALTPTSVDAEAALDAGIAAVQILFQETETADGLATDAYEARHAKLMATGYKNAQVLLSNRAYLYRKLTAIGLKPATNDVGALLGQIAKLQLGQAHEKDGKEIWKVVSRRDERLGRFYRIFEQYPDKFPVETLEATILGFKGRTKGILDWKKELDDAAKARPVSEIEAEARAAVKAAPLASVALPANIADPNKGQFQLVLVSLERGNVHLRKFIEGQDGLTKREAEKWATSIAVGQAVKTMLESEQSAQSPEA